MNARLLAAFLLASTRAFAAESPFTDYRSQKPGARRLIRAADLPAPGATESAVNSPRLAPRPEGAWPKVPPGYSVGLYAEGLDNPRQIKTAPNGDLFVAESSPGRIKIFRGFGKDGKPAAVSTFATGLDRPFGIAFHEGYVYIGETDAVVRLPYRDGDLSARGRPERVLALESGGRVFGGGHWTRDLAFSRDGGTLFVSVGSRTNIAKEEEHHRAVILACDPAGKNVRVHASGLRNAVGIAVDPKTGALWASVNERDGLGDDLPPDYITRVVPGGFYGWPWFYTGGHADPRLAGLHPELKDKALVPDVLIQPHNASLGLTFWRGGLFAAEHGSWNRSRRTGYEVIRVPLENGKAAGGYEDFMTGFVTEDGRVWGRPVGVAAGGDGSLLVSDDGGGRLWRIVPAAKAD